MFYYLSFVSAPAHVKQAVLLTAFHEAVSRDSIVDGDWLRATDWSRPKRYRYDT